MAIVDPGAICRAEFLGASQRSCFHTASAQGRDLQPLNLPVRACGRPFQSLMQFGVFSACFITCARSALPMRPWPAPRNSPLRTTGIADAGQRHVRCRYRRHCRCPYWLRRSDPTRSFDRRNDRASVPPTSGGNSCEEVELRLHVPANCLEF